jgi:predicted MFS family arabinose efflux permease
LSRRFDRARSIALDVSPLRDSVPYRALWLGQVISLMGSNMRLVAVAVQVFEITGSTVAVGVVGLVEVVPLIVFSIVGGAITDRTDRRALIFRTQLGLMVTSLVLAYISFGSDPSVLWIYALTAIASALNAIDRPARAAMTPNLVAPDKLAAAMALRQVVFQTTLILGPALGGVMIASLGGAVEWVYLFDGLSFIAAIVALKWVPSSVPRFDPDQSHLQSVREGMGYVLRNPLALSIFGIDLIAMIFGMPRAVFPELAKESFGMGAEGVGLLFAAPSLGALVAALTTGWVSSVRRQGVAVLWAVAAWGAAITLAGISVFSLVLTLVFLALAGAADVVSAVFRATMLQETTPDALRGRISAVSIMVVTGGPRIGDFEAGLVGGIAGAPASIVIGGVACLLGTGAMASWSPSLARYRTNSEREAVSA